MTVDELRSMTVKLRGYGMPDDNAPDFYTRCKFYEALDIMKEVTSTFPEEFSKLTFEFHSINEEYLFAIHKDLKNIYLGDNDFGLTKDFIRKALGIES